MDHVGLLGLSAQAQESSPNKSPPGYQIIGGVHIPVPGQWENQLGERGESRRTRLIILYIFVNNYISVK